MTDDYQTGRAFVARCILALVDSMERRGGAPRVDTVIRDVMRDYQREIWALQQARQDADASLVGPIVDSWWSHQPSSVREAWENDEFAPSLTGLVAAIVRAIDLRKPRPRRPWPARRMAKRARRAKP